MYEEKLHIAIIMDGNGRWAKNKNLSRVHGHIEGMKTFENLLNNLSDNIGYLTVYAFSTENWNRPIREVYHLFNLMYKYLKEKGNKFLDNNVKVQFIGEIANLPFYIINIIQKLEQLTEKCSGLILNIAISYGGRAEITKAMNNLMKINKKASIQNIQNQLYTKDLPDPHILIRTGGHKRLSNYLLWQLAYTELFFLDKLWPDFNIEDMNKIIREYGKITRNFGKV